jgi:hypothetical protein
LHECHEEVMMLKMKGEVSECEVNAQAERDLEQVNERIQTREQ